MDLSEINWDINEAGGWPVPIKLAAGLLVFLLIIGGGHYQFTSDKLNDLNREEEELTSAINTYGIQWRMALNLELHQQQYKKIEASLAEMMRLMPTQAEMAELLVDISQTGISSGLEFTLFKPTGRIVRDDHVALPINIKVQGMYKELGLFVSGLAALPRIVTIKEIHISPLKASKLLKMAAIVTTYQEIEAGEEQKPSLMDNSYLICLKEEGLIIEGCTGESQVELSIFPKLVQRLKKKREGSVPIRIGEIKKMAPLDAFRYSPEDERDPFNSKTSGKHGVEGGDKEKNGVFPNFNREKSTLERYSLDTLVLTGFIQKKNDPINWGLIKVASGKVHRVKKGHYLGKNYGKIVGISSIKIDIMEIIPNGQGGWEERAASIALSKADEK